jgi:hypothetical protein
MRIFKRRKRDKKTGKIVESKTWYGEYRIESMAHPNVINLHCTEQQVAYSKLSKLVTEIEKRGGRNTAAVANQRYRQKPAD